MSSPSVLSPEAVSQKSEDFLSHPAYADVSREIHPALPRYRNEIGKFSVHRASFCVNCGKCVEICPHDVHIRPSGYKRLIRPFDYRCVGIRMRGDGSLLCERLSTERALGHPQSRL